jgi:hypothetical protein
VAPPRLTIPASGRGWVSPDGSYGFNVDVWAPGSFYSLVDTSTTLESGDIPFEIRTGQTLTFKPGTSFRSAQAVKDIDLVHDVLVETLAQSEDMRTKLKDASGKQGGRAMAIRLVRDDPKVDGGVYRRNSNFFVIDLADLEAAAGRLSAPGVPAAQAQPALDLLSSMRIQVITTSAHELQHARGEGNEDPTPESGDKGLPVLDENHVLGDLGIGLERTAYGSLVGGIPVVPWEYTTLVGGTATTIVLHEGLSNPSTASGPALGNAQRFGPSDLQALDGLPDRCCSGDSSFPGAGTGDSDFDGIADTFDNLPFMLNPQQGAGQETTSSDEVRDGEFTIKASAEWRAEAAASLFLPGREPSSVTDLPEVALSAHVTRLGGPLIRDRRWSYGVGTRVYAGSEFPPPSHGPMTFWAPYFDGKDPEDAVEVRVHSLEYLSAISGNHDIRYGYEQLGAEVLNNVPNYLSEFTPAKHLGTPTWTPRPKERLVSGESGSEALGTALIEESEQNQVSVTPDDSGSPIEQRQHEAATPHGRLWWVARNLVDLFRPGLAAGVAASRLPPGVRLVTGSSGRREYWVDPAPGRQNPAAPPRPSLKVFLQSLGRSTGENAQRAIFINDGNVPVRLMENDVFVTEPLSGISKQALDRELGKFAGRPRMTMNLTAYCLNYRKAPPSAGRVFRVAAPGAQALSGPIRRILHAAERLRQRGDLHPDGDPSAYVHSIRQWAIWTREQRFNEQTFGEALTEHTRKNLAAAGRPWTRELDAAIRSLVPNRWRDVQSVIGESQRFQPPEGR